MRPLGPPAGPATFYNALQSIDLRRTNIPEGEYQ